MIDLSKEELLTVKQARLEFPSRPSVPTIWRWMLKGVRGVVLDSACIGGRRFTSREACRRFLSSQSSASAAVATRGSERQRALSAAQATLDQLGVATRESAST
ncbi:DUF1580 domain-containing protein [Posidoniimonas corsicana]|uniref:DUF1580 domain-containing protein n=1 Tax=Posidoniimonas corsicana TaxID=1938618 RepID=UPI0018D37D68